MNRTIRNWILISMIVLLFLSLAWMWLGRMATEIGPVSSAVKGAQAPDFAAITEDEAVVRLGDYAGKTLVLNFWASWCVPCQQEMPTFDEIYQEMDLEKVDFLMLNVTATESQEKAQRFLDAKGFSFPVAFDLDNSVSSAYQVNSYPMTYVIDGNGTICQRTVGIMNEAMLRVAIEECGMEGAE